MRKKLAMEVSKIGLTKSAELTHGHDTGSTQGVCRKNWWLQTLFYQIKLPPCYKLKTLFY